jgi:hypothetical protein
MPAAGAGVDPPGRTHQSDVGVEQPDVSSPGGATAAAAPRPSDAAGVSPPPRPPRGLLLHPLRHAAGCRRGRVGGGGAPGPAPVGVGAALLRARLISRRTPPARTSMCAALGLQRRRVPRAAAQALLLRREGLLCARASRFCSIRCACLVKCLVHGPSPRFHIILLLLSSSVCSL